MVRLPLAGLTVSQFAPSAVEADADHPAAGPQLPIVTICAAGLPCPWVALKVSDWEERLMQDGLFGDGCTLSVTLTTAIPDPALIVTCPVYIPCASVALATAMPTVDDAFAFN